MSMKKLNRLGGLGLVLCALLTGCQSQPPTASTPATPTPSALPLGPMPLQSFTPRFKPTPVWRHVIDYGSGPYFLHLSPALSPHGLLYIASYRGDIAVINSLNGRRVWQYHYPNHLVSGVALGAHRLFVGTENGHLLAINRASGCVEWSVSLHGQMLARPEVGSRYLFVHTTNGVLSAYDLKNGALVWQQRESTPPLMLYLGSQPLVAGETVLCGFANGRLVAFNRLDGRRLWARQVGEPQGMTAVSRMVDITSQPVVVDGTVYVVSNQGRLLALNLTNGKPYWQHQLSAFANLTVWHNALYLTDMDGVVWAFDRRTGTVLWHQTALAHRNLTAPAATPSALVVGDARGYAHWLDFQDGHFLARVRVSPSSLLAQPIAYGDRVYIYASSGKLIAYRLGTVPK